MVRGTICPTKRGGTAVGDGIVTFAGVEGAVGGDGCDLLVRVDLGEQFWQHRGVADITGGDLDGPDLQCFLIDPELDLAPDPPFLAAMLACAPLPFTVDLDAGAGGGQVQRPS